MSLVACVPNVSEGRRRDVVEGIARAIRTVAGVTLLDHSADQSHNRSVFTSLAVRNQSRQQSRPRDRAGLDEPHQLS